MFSKNMTSNIKNREDFIIFLEKLLESQKVIDILDDIDYDTQEIQTIFPNSAQIPALS